MFFEKKKALRWKKQAEKLLVELNKDLTKDNTVAIEQTKKAILQHDENIEYISYFPDNTKYIALFAGEHTKETTAKIDALREQVKKTLKHREIRRMKEMIEADGDNKKEVVKKDAPEDDGFFASGSIDSSDIEPEAVVDRTGKIIRPKSQKKRDAKAGEKKKSTLP